MSVMKRGRGRPPLAKGERRQETISLRLKTDEVDVLRKAAAKTGKTLSEWLRKNLLDSAK